MSGVLVMLGEAGRMIGPGLMFAGALIALTGAIGVVRFPDFYTRLHAAGVSDTLAMAVFSLGLALYFGWSLDALKIILMALFYAVTAPTTSHAAANAALGGGLVPRVGKWEG